MPTRQNDGMRERDRALIDPEHFGWLERSGDCVWAEAEKTTHNVLYILFETVYARRMEDALIIAGDPVGSSIPARIARGMTPALFGVSKQAQRRFWEFFTAHIRNPNTRHAYLVAVWRFAGWCGHHGIPLARVEPMVVG